MSAPELTDHQQQLLEQLAVGDLAWDAPEIVAASEEPAFAKALRQLDAVTDALEHAAAVEEVSAGGDAADPFPGAGEAVRSQVEALTGAPPPRRSSWWGWAAAAIVLVGAVGWWWSQRADEPGVPPQYLGGVDIEIERPQGEVAFGEFGEFRWKAELPPRGYYEVRVFAEDRITLLAEGLELDEPFWTPSVQLPRSIYWEVRVYTHDGDEAGPWGWAIAERR